MIGRSTRFIGRSALGLALLTAAHLGQAQTATVIGYPANFDTVNNTGVYTAGFEIEADGLQPVDITRIFGDVTPNTTANGCYIRYCSGSIVPFNGGVYIRWTSPGDAAAHNLPR